MHNLSARTIRLYLGVGAALSALVVFALAVDPTPDAIATAGTTGLVSSLLATLNAVWPALVVVFAALIGIGLAVKVTRKTVSDQRVKTQVNGLA